ncbi:Amidohydrolase [Daejeonella rubra]|uniref:Amidohydrolase n=2 Tax=Daejeonella rubra TaxID=990371 RepID=A0A1G9MPQ8_9SPHI|nr:Amidohydrolase [Daejeonella rubra]
MLLFLTSCEDKNKYKGDIFDTHLHAAQDINKQFAGLEKHKIVRGAVSSSWDNQEAYRTSTKTGFLIGLMFPCPNGIVPYSGQKCFSDGREFPDIAWIRQQIIDKKIDFFGELLNEYYGISPSDSIMFPYYELAQEFKLPVGIHTGLAGPNNLCPNYNPLMGDPALMKDILIRFPGLKVWIMHAGAPYLKGTLEILRDYPQVYADISVLANPDIFKKPDFNAYMKSLIDSGFEDRLMFGSDNGDLDKIINSVNELDFLTVEQKEKIFFKNAETFFGVN